MLEPCRSTFSGTVLLSWAHKESSFMWPLQVVWASLKHGRLRAVIILNQGLGMLGMRVLAYMVEIKAPLKKNDCFQVKGNFSTVTMLGKHHLHLSSQYFHSL